MSNCGHGVLLGFLVLMNKLSVVKRNIRDVSTKEDSFCQCLHGECFRVVNNPGGVDVEIRVGLPKLCQMQKYRGKKQLFEKDNSRKEKTSAVKRCLTKYVYFTI